jgi:hypothetical protein
MERSFELAIDMEIAALGVLQKHHSRTVIEDGPKSCFTFPEFFLSSLAFGYVQKCRPPIGDVARLIVYCEALKIDATGVIGLSSEVHLTGLSCACLQDLLTMPLKCALITPCNETSE